MELLTFLNGTAVDRASQRIAMFVLIVATVALFAASALAALDVLPWPDLFVLTAGGEPVAVGKWVLLGASVLLLLLTTLLPGSFRVLHLERSHRDFTIAMDDVARAYWMAHAADRAGTFGLSREFDAVRERFRFLREHPDLEDIQPELLELAAQMGAESRELARQFSDTKVTQAREMLEARRCDAAEMQERIAKAVAVTGQMKRMLAEVEMDEAMSRSALVRLREELDELLPRIEAATRDPEPPKRPRLRVAATDSGK